MSTETKELYLRYDFTEDEKTAMAKRMAAAVQEQEILEADKKQAVADFKSKIEMTKLTISSSSQKIANGHEYRHVECEITYNSPINGFKTIRRMDTYHTWEEQMDRNDFNLFNQGKTSFVANPVMDDEIAEEIKLKVAKDTKKPKGD